ncbi:MAG TPA: type IX secretion system membrane protein PorP/SprF [Bacteroidia bacterium]|jgi:type IX secretion system PorP/SprF family membrane protein|nr:type IX secretion system membrane protein PorP/SprF [Bacteroidia bacterium]
MRKIICITFFLLFAFIVKAQHSAMYSQYMFNGLLINPAYAGSNEVLSATAVNRNQWIGFDGAPRTTTFSIHSPLKNKKVNLGITFINDQYGITKQNKINAVYAYRIFFKKSSFSFGLQAGFNFVRNNWNQITTTTAGDQVFTGQYSQQNIPQAGFGIYYKHEKFFVGISAPDLLTLKKIDGLLYKPALLNVGYLFSVSEELKIKPSVVLKYIRNSPIEIDFNTNVYFKAFGLGLSYRTNDAMVFMVTYNINSQFSAGYSYDLTISKLGTYVRGSHEIMLRYEFGYKVNPQSPRYF